MRPLSQAGSRSAPAVTGQQVPRALWAAPAWGLYEPTALPHCARLASQHSRALASPGAAPASRLGVYCLRTCVGRGAGGCINSEGCKVAAPTGLAHAPYPTRSCQAQRDCSGALTAGEKELRRDGTLALRMAGEMERGIPGAWRPSRLLSLQGASREAFGVALSWLNHAPKRSDRCSLPGHSRSRSRMPASSSCSSLERERGLASMPQFPAQDKGGGQHRGCWEVDRY